MRRTQERERVREIESAPKQKFENEEEEENREEDITPLQFADHDWFSSSSKLAADAVADVDQALSRRINKRKALDDRSKPRWSIDREQFDISSVHLFGSFGPGPDQCSLTPTHLSYVRLDVASMSMCQKWHRNPAVASFAFSLSLSLSPSLYLSINSHTHSAAQVFLFLFIYTFIFSVRPGANDAHSIKVLISFISFLHRWIRCTRHTLYRRMDTKTPNWRVPCSMPVGRSSFWRTKTTSD